MGVVHTGIVWGRVSSSGSKSGVLHAWRRHQGVWLPSLCGRAPAVLNTATMEAEEDRLAHLPICQACVVVVHRDDEAAE